MREQTKRNYGAKRYFRKRALNIAKGGMIPSSFRLSPIQYAGVNFVEPSSVFIGENVSFDNIYPEYITVGKNVRLTAGTIILTHYLYITKTPFNIYCGRVVIDDNVLIGTKSIVVKPCKIVNNVAIAAGSMLHTDIPDDWIMGGVPAKKIGERKT